MTDLSPADLSRAMRHMALRRIAKRREQGSGLCVCGAPIPEGREAYCSPKCSMAARNKRRRTPQTTPE